MLISWTPEELAAETAAIPGWLRSLLLSGREIASRSELYFITATP
jgi:hypothetical protein